MVSDTRQRDQQGESVFCGLRKQKVWGAAGTVRTWQKLIVEKYTCTKSETSSVIW